MDFIMLCVTKFVLNIDHWEINIKYNLLCKYDEFEYNENFNFVVDWNGNIIFDS